MISVTTEIFLLASEFVTIFLKSITFFCQLSLYGLQLENYIRSLYKWNLLNLCIFMVSLLILFAFYSCINSYLKNVCDI